MDLMRFPGNLLLFLSYKKMGGQLNNIVTSNEISAVSSYFNNSRTMNANDGWLRPTLCYYWLKIKAL